MRVRVSLAILMALLLGAADAPRARPLTVGLAAETTSLDPHFFLAATNLQVARHIYDALIHQDERQRLVPGLALSWRPLSDTLWEFKLRPGVRFHDGGAFSADDVVFTIRRAGEVPNSPGSFGIYTRRIVETMVVDALTIRIRTDGPHPNLAVDLSALPIVARGSVTATAELDSGRGVNGTGPFRLVEWLRGERLVLERNDAYWGERPVWSRVTLRPIPNGTARVAALLSGAVDIINFVPPSALETVRQEDGMALVGAISNRVIYLAIDSTRDVSPYATGADGKPLPANPLRDRRVRLALSKAIDRPALATQIMAGDAVPAGQLLPEGYWGVSPRLKPEPFDPAGARRLLAEAGVTDGFGLTLLCPNNRYINDDKICQALAQMFARIGVRTAAEASPASVALARAGRFDFSMLLWGWGSESGEPGGPLRALLGTPNPARGWGSVNRGRYSNSEFDSVLERALATVDDETRERLLQRATEIAIGDLGLIPVHFEVANWAMRRGLDYTPRADAYTLAQLIRAR